MAMLDLCGFSDDSLFKSKCELEEKEAYECFRNDNTTNQMNLYTLPGNVSVSMTFSVILVPNRISIDKGNIYRYCFYNYVPSSTFVMNAIYCIR